MFANRVLIPYNYNMIKQNRIPLNEDYINKKLSDPYKLEPIFDSISSTNTYVKENYHHLKHGTVIISKHQISGRGRFERSFESNDDVGIYCSFLLKDNLNKNILEHINLKVACALHSSIKHCFNIETQIKWPNDLILNHRKCAGILIETQMNVNSNQYDCLIIGWGLNVYNQDFSNSLKETATTLEENTDTILNRNDLIVHFFNNLNDFLTRIDIIDYYKEFMIPVGTWIKLSINNAKESVKIVNINSEGQLIVETENGSLIKLYNEEILLK
jgi:BirA family transcriptional regulator, biotin operon repressor / biotin---[acetyl-CoA-carboxylase] ligase